MVWLGSCIFYKVADILVILVRYPFVVIHKLANMKYYIIIYLNLK